MSTRLGVFSGQAADDFQTHDKTSLRVYLRRLFFPRSSHLDLEDGASLHRYRVR
jgi:hypothetical protein